MDDFDFGMEIHDPVNIPHPQNLAGAAASRTKNKVWDAASGLWIEQQVSGGVNVNNPAASALTIESGSKASAAVPSSSAASKTRITRPKGRTPKGKMWDEETGLWVESTGEEASSSSYQALTARRDPASAIGIVRGPGGKGRPKKALPILLTSGKGYKRPQGRAPAGQKWDKKDGRWIGLDETMGRLTKEAIMRQRKKERATASAARKREKENERKAKR